jgi:hypothetical protein
MSLTLLAVSSTHESFDDIGDRPNPLGTRPAVLDKLRAVLPGVDFDDALGVGEVLGTRVQIAIRSVDDVEPNPFKKERFTPRRGPNVHYLDIEIFDDARTDRFDEILGHLAGTLDANLFDEDAVRVELTVRGADRG